MNIKDCMYGQVRAVDDNIFRSYDVEGMATPATIPAVLKPHIKTQQVITWDNTTGMNPLWDQPPVDNVIYKAYGEMFRDAYEISVYNGLTYVPDLIEAGLSVKEYDVKVQGNFQNNYSMLCMSLGFWWHIHQLLNQPDALDYDYLILRQMDTWFYPLMSEKCVEEVFTESRKKVLLSPQYNEPNVPINDIPVIWACSTTSPVFPMTTWIDSFFYMLNRQTVRILQQDFFARMLREIEIFYKRNGAKARPIIGKPGTTFHHVAIKNDITVIDITAQQFCFIADRRTVSASDYSRNERNVTQVNL